MQHVSRCCDSTVCPTTVSANRYERALEDLFERDEETQAAAVQALQQLAAPIEYPHEFVVVTPARAESTSKPVKTEQLHVNVGEKQELLANVLEEEAKSSVAEAAFLLGVLSATGVSPVVEQNDAYANKMYALAADYGSVPGHLALAHRYEQGFNVPKSCSIAYAHLKVCQLALFAVPAALRLIFSVNEPSM